jgi:hypothetical protein
MAVAMTQAKDSQVKLLPGVAIADENWRGKRRPPSHYDDTLLLPTVGWMRQLPRQIFPLETARRFPRILNRLAHFWDAPRMLDTIFEELLHDTRGNRKGFPTAIHIELLHLHDYHRWLNQPNHVKKDAWDGEPEFGRRANGSKAL